MESIVQQLEIRDLGPHGLEAVLTVVNEGEEPVRVHGAQVHVWKDERDLGIHPVSFREAGPDARIVLGQFEFCEGHFHLPPEPEHHRLHFSVSLDCRAGDQPETRRISRRMETGRIRRTGG
jgi:hypothetical protein